MEAHGFDDDPSLTLESMGAYRLVAPLGKGGMGEVFLAWDERLKRNVAIKRIRADRTSDDSSRGRFRREARAVAKLSHPAIVQVFDVLESDAGDAIVMEYVEGRSLVQAITAGDLDLPTIVRLAGEITAGLGEAHGKGLAHRDLKPENVMLTAGPRARAKILDFGLARALFKDALTNHPEDSLTASGAVVGTAYAMSPEQAYGRPVDHRGDLFALGNLLYMMLTGVAPFRGESFLDTLRKVASWAPEPVSTLRPDVPEALSDLTARLLAKNPLERPQNATLVEAELHKIGRALEDGSPSTARPAAELLPQTARDDAPTFLSGVDVPPGGPRHVESDARTVVRTLVLTDLIDSTRLVESLGDQRTSEIFARHDRMARDLLERHDGQEIDKSDGFLLLFERPFDAVGFTLRYHQALMELAAELDVPLAARAAVHLGEVVLRYNRREDVSRGAKPIEVEGLAKPTAARLMSLAVARQTLLSRSAFDLGRRSAVDEERWDENLRWLAHGAYIVKGVEEPVEVFEVGLAGVAPLIAPDDSGKARRAVTVSDELTLGWRPANGQPIPRRPHWTLVRRLGGGGFGEVWLARHKSGEMRVYKFCFEADRLRGLKREVTLFRVLRDALGERGDIARILDWSFDEAPYFLEVEHTEGGSLADWAEQQGGIAALPLATRLEIAAKIAVALGAAHSVGILHKDIKPENVLVFEDVDGKPHIRLTDFGIGRLTDETLLAGKAFTIQGMTEATTTASAGGTPESGTRIYMAPELLEGKPASIQADLYAFGVLLYQVAAGDLSRALAPGWERDVADELVAADIAALVDRDPSRRPASALVVAEGLRGLGERRAALEARRRAAAAAETAREAEERARRRRKMLSVAGTVAAIGLVAVSFLAVRAEMARRDAEAARTLAEHRRSQAEDLIGFMLGDLPEKLAPLGSLEVLADVSDKAMEYFADLAVEDVTSDTLVQRAKALQQIGDVRLQQHDLEAAQEAFERSLVQMERLVGQEPGRGDLRAGLADTRFWLGYVLWRRGDVKAALAAYEEHRRAYEVLVEEEPGQEDWALELAYGHMNVGDAQLALGRLVEAREHHVRALNLVEELANAHPERTELRFEMAQGHLRVGRIKVRLGDVESALVHFGADLRILRGLLDENPQNTAWQQSFAVTFDHIGSAREGRAEPRQALESFLRAEELLTELTALDATNAEWRMLLLRSRSNVARVLASLGRTDEALQRFEDNRVIARDVVNEDPSNGVLRRALVTAHNGLARVRLQRGERDRALEDASAAVEVARRLAEAQSSAQHHRWLSSSLSVLAAVHAARGEDDAARDAREQALSSIEESARDSRDPEILQRQIEALVSLGRLDEARAVVDRLLQRASPDVRFSSYLREHGIEPSY